MVAPATDEEVTHVYMAVRRVEPRFPNFAYGFLYATASPRRRTVAIPYNYGVTKLQSVNDLYVHVWVPLASVSSNVVDMAAGRVQVDRLPQSSVPFEHSYSIIYVPPSQPIASSVNSCRSLRSAVQWRGNILVVKHGKRKPVINMDGDDAVLVDMLVSDYLSLLPATYPSIRSPPTPFSRWAARVKRNASVFATLPTNVKGDAFATRAAVVANRFYCIPEMFGRELLPHCTLETVMVLSLISHYARNLIRAFFLANQRTLLEPFVEETNLNAFYDVLESSLSGMAGSFASSLLTPATSLTVSRSYPSKNRRVSTDFTISITESNDNSLFTPLIGATTTLNTTLCTAARFYSLYASLLSQRRALEAWFPTPVRKAVAIGKRRYRSSFSTASWERPCGIHCPILWRHIRGLEKVGIFTWGGYKGQHGDFSEVGIPFSDTDLKWRLGDTCSNENCPWRHGNYFAIPTE
ncbi:hypothetical protein C8F04DRAFT_1268530 [Mycena alexandri]|uniref:Uncharacterized protein n=1 Tax=Mycena alexandri TaxID=1745969 RepID=A0AAD6SDQ2_9AGAR|nr:hypothetical protein C8F04DRAFT_1268530 [Mycena alexandri]